VAPRLRILAQQNSRQTTSTLDNEWKGPLDPQKSKELSHIKVRGCVIVTAMSKS